ncbi:probable ethanolamine kinase isoform X2 [Tanacetum coccineum]
MMIYFQCKVPSLLKVEIIYFWCESLAEALGIQPRVMSEGGHTRLTTVVKDLFKQWSHLDESHFSAERFYGGITNLCSTQDTEYVINSHRELQTWPKMAAEIAKQLKNFHQVDVPGSKELQLWTDILKFLKRGIFFYIHLLASSLTFDDGEKQKFYMKISFEEVKAEISLRHLNAPVVFAHNDLLSGNLMLNDDERKLYFIDLE